METQKIKHYRLPISRTFPITHPKSGQPTYFVEKIRANNILDEMSLCWEPKLHTCRGKYDRWVKIMQEVQAGKAVIDLYYWDGKPYGKGVKQVVFATLDKDSRCGVQMLYFSHSVEFPRVITEDNSRLSLMPKTIAKNDGLSVVDFKAWFKGADLIGPMAIIHFTSFRY